MKVLMILALAAIVYCAKAATLNKRDVKSELLTRAAALEKNAAAEATKLRADGRTMAADNLERDAKRLAAVAKELEHAFGLALIPLELELGVIERRIAEEIRRDERQEGTPGTRPTGSPPTGSPPTGSPRPQPTGSSPRPQPTGSPPTGTPRPQPTGTPAFFVKRSIKSDLLAKAAALEKSAAAEATKLRAEGRTEAADMLEHDSRTLARIARELEHALPLAILPLEVEINAIERRVAAEIRRDQEQTGTPGPKPTGSPPTGSPPTGSPPTGSPRPQPTGTPTGSPRPQPTGTPTGSPRPQPTGTPTGSPRPQPTGTPTRPTPAL